MFEQETPRNSNNESASSSSESVTDKNGHYGLGTSDNWRAVEDNNACSKQIAFKAHPGPKHATDSNLRPVEYFKLFITDANKTNKYAERHISANESCLQATLYSILKSQIQLT